MNARAVLQANINPLSLAYRVSIDTPAHFCHGAIPYVVFAIVYAVAIVSALVIARVTYDGSVTNHTPPIVREEVTP